MQDQKMQDLEYEYEGPHTFCIQHWQNVRMDAEWAHIKQMHQENAVKYAYRLKS